MNPSALHRLALRGAFLHERLKDKPLVPVLMHKPVHDGQPDLTEVIGALLGFTIIKTGTDDDAVLQGTQALKEDRITRHAGDLRQDQGATWNLEVHTLMIHLDGGDTGDDTISLNGYRFTSHQDTAKLQAQVAVHFIVVDTQMGIFPLDLLQLGRTQFLEFVGLLRNTHHMQSAAKLLREQGGSNIVVATVNGEYQDSSRVRPHLLEMDEVMDVPCYLTLKMHVPEAVQIGQRKLLKHLITCPPAAEGTEVRSQAFYIAQDCSTLRCSQEIDHEDDRRTQRWAQPHGQKSHQLQQYLRPESSMQTGISPTWCLRWGAFGGFFFGHGYFCGRASVTHLAPA